MKRSRFREEQIIGILKEYQPGVSAKDLCRKHRISQATYFNLKKKYAGMLPTEMKKIVADLSLDKEMLQDVIKRKL